MAITLITRDYDNNIDLESEVFVGRVLRVEHTPETRNWSDTMDYTDYRTTNCTYALVWLGTHGIPPEHINTDRPRAHWGSLRGAHEQLPDYLTDKVRELEYFEQFAWVDCTNLHGDRMVSKLVNAQTDAATFVSGDPLMWANFIAWKSYQKAESDRRLNAAQVALEAARKEKEDREAVAAARAAKREAKAAATKVDAEAAFVNLPANGTELTVKGFTGRLFWKKVTQFRGTWAARFGLKNTKGDVAWFTSEDM